MELIPPVFLLAFGFWLPVPALIPFNYVSLHFGVVFLRI